LLESVEGGEKWGRYSIIGLPAKVVLSAIHNEIILTDNGVVTERVTGVDPYLFVREYLARFKVPPNDEMSRFAGGLVGYFGYDTVRYVEPKLERTTPTGTLDTPDILLMLSDEFLVFDNLKGKIQFVCYVDPSDQAALGDASRKLASLAERLQQPVSFSTRLPGATSSVDPNFESEFGHDAFVASIGKMKQYIVEGDVMQVVLAQRLSTNLDAPAVDVQLAAD